MQRGKFVDALGMLRLLGMNDGMRVCLFVGHYASILVGVTDLLR